MRGHGVAGVTAAGRFGLGRSPGYHVPPRLRRRVQRHHAGHVKIERGQPWLDHAQQRLDGVGRPGKSCERSVNPQRHPHQQHRLLIGIDLQLPEIQLCRRLRRISHPVTEHARFLAGVLGPVHRLATRSRHHGIPADHQRQQRPAEQPVQHQLPLHQYQRRCRRRRRRGDRSVQPGRHLAHLRHELDGSARA